MIKRKLENQMSIMREYVIEMKDKVIEVLEKSLKALENKDRELAKNIINIDEKLIDEYQYDIEDLCGRIIATEHPVATDLRELLAVIKIVASLERIADHASHIVKVVLLLKADDKISEFLDPYLIPLREMGDTAKEMLNDIFDAYVDGAFSKILKITKYDNIIDKLYHKEKEGIIKAMKKHPENLDYLLNILFLNRFLERVGDHVATIGELLYFARLGEKVDLN